jgi:uncharacterized protein (DUF1501 family)
MDHSKRLFLSKTLAFACSAAASPLMTPMTLASVPSDKRLVVIVLRGGMDGLDLLRPSGDPLLAAYRPALIARAGNDLNGYFSLHPDLAGLMPMWQAGELGFVQAVSTPYRNKRSHFDGQDILESGSDHIGADTRDSGWINRMLGLIPDADKETAFSVGRENLLLMRGDQAVSSWSPAGRMDISPQAKLLLEAIYAKDPLFAEAGQAAITLAGQLSTQSRMPPEESDENMMQTMVQNLLKAGRAQKAEGLARFAAGRLREDTRIAAFSLGGWDTHLKQYNTMRRALGQLQSALVTLKAELGAVWQDTAVLCMTEFGRTVRENGSEGTDHGTGGAMVLAGGAIRGGKVYGDWPGIAGPDLFAGRDLLPTNDVRRYAAWIVRGFFGLEVSSLEKTVFPGLDMKADPRLLL